MSLNESYAQEDMNGLTPLSRTYKINADALLPDDHFDVRALVEESTEVIVWTGDEKISYKLSPNRPDVADLLTQKLASLIPGQS